jgi:hypothetical protein
VITGYNTDVLFEGTTYHVQSEDRGADNPILDTLIYCGGRILDQVKTDYSEELGPEAEEREVMRRLEAQHREYVRRARQGHYADHRPTVSEVIDDEGELAEVILGALEGDESAELLEITFQRVGQGLPLRGALRVVRGRDGEPAGSARVSARLVGEGLRSASLLDDETNEAGVLDVALAIPSDAASAIIFSAERGGGGGRLRVSLSASPA